MLTSRITEGENRQFKTNLKQKTDHHNGDLNKCTCFFIFFVWFILLILNG